jgi:hypothetical protein
MEQSEKCEACCVRDGHEWDIWITDELRQLSATLCSGCYSIDDEKTIAAKVRASRRPASTPEAKAWEPKPGDWCEGGYYDHEKKRTEVRRGRFIAFGGLSLGSPNPERWAALDGGDDYPAVVSQLVTRDSLRPAAPPSHPAAAAEAVKTPTSEIQRPASLDEDGKYRVAPSGGDSGHPNADERARVRRVDEATACAQAMKDTAYRQKVAALTLDLDRPSVPRRDRLGRELVPWTGWVSTRHAK